MRPLPATNYVIFLLILGILGFALITYNMSKKAQELSLATKAEQQAAASEELNRAFENTLSKVQNSLNELTIWDEVQQQLREATYYVYWREHRLNTAGYFPNYLFDLELYDVDGNALVQLRQLSTLPQQIPNTALVFQKQDNNLVLLIYKPIPSRNGDLGYAGHVGIAIDFLQAVQHYNRFSHIDSNSLELIYPPAPDITTHELQQIVSFKTYHNDTLNALHRIMLNNMWYLAILIISSAIVFYLGVITLFSNPLQQLVQHLDALRKGQKSNFAQNTFAVKEIDHLRDSLSAYQADLNQANQFLDEKNQQLWRLAHTDPLTGVRNRRGFDEDWERYQRVPRQRQDHVVFMLIDCDFFKAINDTYGHQVGDQVLQALSGTLQNALRPGDIVYRMGGDEFATLLYRTELEQAVELAQHCLAAISAYPFTRFGVNEPINLSIGLANARSDEPAKLSDLPKRADMAMYQAKRSSINKIVVYDPNFDKDAAALLSNRLVNATLNAIRTGENLTLHYQPIIHSQTGETDYYEALLRIRNHEEWLKPDTILPIVTRRGLNLELDLAVLKAIQHDLELGLLPPNSGVAINFCGSSLIRPEIHHALRALQPWTQSHKLVLEVTETELITQLQKVSQLLQNLRDNGFKVALDDFGSGYSSLLYLARIPADVVKLDISMMRALNGDERTRKIVTHTASMIRETGFSMVAEGIENDIQRHQAIQIGATHLQGYFLGEPEPLKFAS